MNASKSSAIATNIYARGIRVTIAVAFDALLLNRRTTSVDCVLKVDAISELAFADSLVGSGLLDFVKVLNTPIPKIAAATMTNAARRTIHRIRWIISPNHDNMPLSFPFLSNDTGEV
jgi:hypothetical protein